LVLKIKSYLDVFFRHGCIYWVKLAIKMPSLKWEGI
jgi:hypothetical protein